MDANVNSRRIVASGVILSVLTLERLAYYTLITTFYLFLNKGPWSLSEAWNSLDALNAVFVLQGVSYISALMGGYISDAWLGRFRTILSGLLLYMLGYLLLILIAVDKLPRNICSEADRNHTVLDLPPGPPGTPHSPCQAAVYLAIVVLGMGVGMFKANIGPFGAEQLGPTAPALARSFFNWYYWCVNVGSVVGIGALAFVAQDDPGLCTNGFFCSYVVAEGCLALAFILLIALCPLFFCYPATGNSPLFNIVRITWEATKLKFRDWRMSRNNDNFPPPLVRPRFLDLAKVRYGGRFHETAVDDVRALGSMLALFAALLPYWLVYFQMQTSFQAQGLHMRFMFSGGGNGTNNTATTVEDEEDVTTPEPFYESAEADTTKWQFSVPAAWLTLFNQVFLLVALPLLTRCVYPYLDRTGLRISVLSRIGVGMFVSCMAVFTAGGLETFRTLLWRTDNSTHIIQTVGNVTFNAVDLSIFWQVPQYVLVAAAEALASIAGLEYAYSEAPRSFQSLIMGIFYAMEGIGSFLGFALLQMLAPFWLNNMTDYANINDNHLDFYLYFLGIIQLVTLVVYGVTIYVSRFTLELVPLRCDEGIGGPLDGRRRTTVCYPHHIAGYRRIADSTYEERLRRGGGDTVGEDDEAPQALPRHRLSGSNQQMNDGYDAVGARGGDEDLLHVQDDDDLLPGEDSDESVGVHETTAAAGGQQR